MVSPSPNAGLFTRIVRRLSVWLQPRAPRSFTRFRQRRGWFQPRCITPPATREKRQDLLRRREFDHLRSLRASALWPPLQESGLSHAAERLAPPAAPTAPERAHIRQKIDAIEAQMSRHPLGATTVTSTRVTSSAHPDPHPDAETGADKGATRIGPAVHGSADAPRRSN